MKLSTTLIFFLLFTVVTAVFMYLARPKPEPPSAPETAAPASSSLLGLKPQDAITLLQIQNLEKKEIMTLALDGDDWVLKYPVRYPANKNIVDEMVESLAAAKKIRELTPEKDWEEYGLMNPSIKIGLQTADHPQRRYLYLGQPSPVGDSVFARWEGAEDYFLLDAGIKEVFGHSVYSVREKKIFRLPFNEIYRIEFQIGSTLYAFARRQKMWMWLWPRSIRAMTLTDLEMEGLISQMTNLFIKDFLDGKEEKIDLDFFQTVYKIRTWARGARKEVFAVGQEALIRDSYYGKRHGEEVLFLVDRGAVRALFETVETMSRESTAVTA